MPRARKTAETAPEAEQERKTLLRKAYGTATQALRDAHKDEFQDLYVQAATDLGVEYTPRLSPEQRAEVEFARLVEEYPHLKDRLKAEGQLEGAEEEAGG